MTAEKQPPRSEAFIVEPTTSEIAKVFRDEYKLKARELLLTSRLIHDTMCAAAARGYDLLVYTPTVDSDGFDVILDDRDKLIPLQLKSVLHDAATSGWEIHRRVLRPQIHHLDALGFESSPCGDGRGGGVVLMDVVPRGAAVDVTYSYTDVLVLMAFWLGALSIKGRGMGMAAKAVAGLQQDLVSEPNGTICVPRSAFLTAKSPEHLLALMGLHCRYNYSWDTNVYQLAQAQTDPEKCPAPPDVMREHIGEQLAYLCHLPKSVQPFKRQRSGAKPI